MTIFAFFWAALLPHHPVIVHLPQSLERLAAGLYAAFLPPLDVVNLPLQTSANEPLQLQPQLFWPPAAEVDWQRWHATAAVAVVPESSATNRDSDVGKLSLTSGPCGGADGSALDAPDIAGFAVQVNDVTIGQVPSLSAAEEIAGQIRQAMPLLEANPDGLTPSLGESSAAGQVDGQTVFVLPDLAENAEDSDDEQTDLQATQWVNNLRHAFGAGPLDAVRVQMVAYGLGETHQTLGGTASWYGPYFHGRQTATGEIFNQHELTAAHKTLPFGTYLKVRNQLNGRTVVVRVNDRGPYIGDRSLDLSYAAAQCLGAEHVGVIPYQATILAPGVPLAWRSNTVAALP
jgi:rare lipoprotein A (peptidoglycan hydrolase)